MNLQRSCISKLTSSIGSHLAEQQREDAVQDALTCTHSHCGNYNIDNNLGAVTSLNIHTKSNASVAMKKPHVHRYETHVTMRVLLRQCCIVHV